VLAASQITLMVLLADDRTNLPWCAVCTLLHPVHRLDGEGRVMVQAMTTKMMGLFSLLKEAAKDWHADKSFQLGAALAYYAVFSLAPLLLISISVAGLAYGEAAARGELVEQLEGAAGPMIARALEEGLSHVHLTESGVLATLLGIVMVLISATGVFGSLQDSLNTIWDVQPRKNRGRRDVIKDRLGPFLMVLLCGALLLGLLVINSLLAVMDEYVPRSEIPGALYLWRGFDLGLTFALMTLMVALVYKVLPDVNLGWKDVWLGAVVTAGLLLVGNWLIGLYLRWSGRALIYGAAGSLVVLLLWVYYSSQVFLFGAELTHIYANRHGPPRQPKGHAEPCTSATP
jgi:membrane protein